MNTVANFVPTIMGGVPRGRKYEPLSVERCILQDYVKHVEDVQ